MKRLDEHCELSLGTSVHKCQVSFLIMGEVSKRGRNHHIIDIATTAVLLYKNDRLKRSTLSRLLSVGYLIEIPG